MNESRRLKIWSVSPDALVHMLNWPWEQENKAEIQVMRLEGLPDGFRVRAVDFNYAKQYFDIVVEHPDFDVVPEGYEIPGDSIALHAVYRVPVIPAERVDKPS